MTHNSNVPTGEDYLVKIVSISKKAVTRGMATILTYEVLEGPYRGEQIVDYLSFRHESEYARKIAEEKYTNICKATGVSRLLFSDHFVGKTMIIHMDMEQGLNTVSRSGYRPASGFRIMDIVRPTKPEEELVIEFAPPNQCEYMIIRRHGCSRRVNFSSDDDQEERMTKMTEAIRELDFVSGKINGGK
jgi:hypothetical protein